jgi:Dynamin family
VQIHSPDVPDLTVVDLPGTTTIPMKNQPASIVSDLEGMALHYISDPNSIILAVTPANADVANSQVRTSVPSSAGLWTVWRRAQRLWHAHACRTSPLALCNHVHA